MKNLLRFAAITVASTALIAGGTTAATAAPGDTAAITTFKLKQGATYYKTSNFISGTVVASAPGSSSFYGVKATVTVNGKAVKTGVPVYQNGIYFDRAWGAGTVKLINFTASGYDTRPGHVGAYYDRPIPAPANSTRVRYAVESTSGVKVTKRGKKLTFKLTATYRDKAGKRKERPQGDDPGQEERQVEDVEDGPAELEGQGHLQAF
ncbi:hypothetical protein [Aeromicrobium sp. UC242_57]|uniref:hypothetical protein n=1 Tax=Aeromicrobium sp. UC242_57 TaxID=3374624 RepID=UPI00378DB32F